MSVVRDSKRPLSALFGAPYRAMSQSAVDARGQNGSSRPKTSPQSRENDYEFPGDLGYLRYRGRSL